MISSNKLLAETFEIFTSGNANSLIKLFICNLFKGTLTMCDKYNLIQLHDITFNLLRMNRGYSYDEKQADNI